MPINLNGFIRAKAAGLRGSFPMEEQSSGHCTRDPRIQRELNVFRRSPSTDVFSKLPIRGDLVVTKVPSLVSVCSKLPYAVSKPLTAIAGGANEAPGDLPGFITHDTVTILLVKSDHVNGGTVLVEVLLLGRDISNEIGNSPIVRGLVAALFGEWRCSTHILNFDVTILFLERRGR